MGWPEYVSPAERIETKPVVYDKRKIAAQRILSKKDMIVMDGHPLSEHYAFILEAEFASRLHDSVTVRYPEGWWQALKERWAPQWLLKRRPVEYTEVIMNAESYLHLSEMAVNESDPFIAFDIMKITHDDYTP